MRQRPFRAVSANPNVRCKSFKTFKEAEKCILQMIKDEGDELDHINDDSEHGWTTYVSWNDWAFVIVDMNKRDEINNRPFDY